MQTSANLITMIKTWAKLIYLLLIAAVLTACAGATSSSSPSHGSTPQLTPLHRAVLTCDADVLYATLADKDRTLLLDGKGANDADGLSDETIVCLLNSVGADQSTIDLITSKRAISSFQHAEWTSDSGDYKAVWGYTRNAGLFLNIHMP